MTCIVWFRQDLRLDDHPALTAAVQSGEPVVCLYVHAPHDEGTWAPGGASKWWLHQSLRELDASLRALGNRLILRSGKSAADVVRDVACETQARALYFSARYEPAAIEQERRVARELKATGVSIYRFHASVLWEPGTVMNRTGGPMQVFTPFWKACLASRKPTAPLPAPSRVAAPAVFPASDALADLKLEPSIDWAGGLRATWKVGEAAAHRELKAFLDSVVADYSDDRNRPDLRGTSRMSPRLHFGEISPRRIWHEAHRRMHEAGRRSLDKGSEHFIREVGWREFACHLLVHFPHTAEQPLRPEWRAFPWRSDPKLLRAWQRGQTGYPIVDAGMRELYETGWMHNRVRMIVGSFLVKDLLLPWQEGARWFWDTLVDADLASNSLGWQWVAGSGADAAPYFRIFNPVLQAEKFDPDGTYVRRYVPELARMPREYIHRPWDAGPLVLMAAGVELGSNYPRPLVDHAQARDAALAAYQALRDGAPT